MNASRQGNDGVTPRRDTRYLAAGALAAMMLAGGVASATGDSNIAISGNSTFSDCGAAGSDLALRMTGDLKGCLSIFIQDYTCKELTDFAHYREYGRESFVGTLRGKAGRFTTDYTVDAAYAKGFCKSLDYSLEVSGTCIHNIRGRSGAFADADGVFKLFDVITNVTGDPVTGAYAPGTGANNFLYYGHIRKRGGAHRAAATAGEAAPLQVRSSAAAIAAARKAQSGRSC